MYQSIYTKYPKYIYIYPIEYTFYTFYMFLEKLFEFGFLRGEIDIVSKKHVESVESIDRLCLILSGIQQILRDRDCKLHYIL